MKNEARFILITIFLFATVLSGCASFKEMGKGFMGVSTQVLEQKRKDALKKSFALSYSDCYVKVKDILKDATSLKEKAPYIYKDDPKEKMIAIYFSFTDTTPVGIFFTDQAAAGTLIEISSPSSYAKEEMAKRIFSGLAANSLTPVQTQKENKVDVKEKINN